MDSPAAPAYLFVYGTLRHSDSHPMHRLLLPATVVGPGYFRGKLYDVGSYPAAVFSDTDPSRVHGELYQLLDPASTFARLDEYEACTAADPRPHEYVRAVVPIHLDKGGPLPASVYLYNHPTVHLTPIPSGDYLQWRSHSLSAPPG